MEQKCIEKNLEIFGINKETINEDLHEVIKKVAVQMKVPSTAVAAIHSIRRTGPQRPQEAGQRPRSVIVELTNREAKDGWLEAAKASRTITNNDVYKNGKEGDIMVREQLTTH